MRRVSSTLIPRTPDGCRILCSHFCCPAPRPRGLNSGTEKALIQLQNRDFVILGQNLPDFCHRLGDARPEPGMTGRRFRVQHGMTMRSPIWSGMTSGAGRSRSFAVLRMTGSGTRGTFPVSRAGSGEGLQRSRNTIISTSGSKYRPFCSRLYTVPVLLPASQKLSR